MTVRKKLSKNLLTLKGNIKILGEVSLWNQRMMSKHKGNEKILKGKRGQGTKNSSCIKNFWLNKTLHNSAQ